jgi:uncharacterized protein (TIGR00645 family)
MASAAEAPGKPAQRGRKSAVAGSAGESRVGRLVGSRTLKAADYRRMRRNCQPDALFLWSVHDPGEVGVSMEQRFERGLLSSRWLLVPLYLVLVLLLVVFAFRAVIELIHLFENLFAITEIELVLAALGLIDLALVGDLLVMVALSSYEAMVSTIDAKPESEKPSWLGKYDAGTIKLKVASSLVAISAIHLLRTYLNSTDVPLDRLLVLTGVHLAFVISALILAFVDKIAFAAHREQH